MPRRLSCPAIRIGLPSSSSDPKANSSPIAQSMPPSDAIAARRCSSGISLGCTVKPSGSATKASAICLTTSRGTAVGRAAAPTDVLCSAGGSMPSPVPSSAEEAIASRVSLKTRSSWPW